MDDEAPPLPPPQATRAAPIRVLIADESPRITSNVSARLRGEAGIQVCAVAHDGEQAIQAALNTRPDVAVIDAALPGMDGPQTTEMLTQYLPRTGVIMVSLEAENEAYRRAMLAGAREFLQKPFTGDDLVAAIRRVHAFELRKGGPASPEIEPAAEPVRRGEVFTVIAGKGGVGKSTIAANCAVALARRHRVALLDCSLQFGDIAAVLNVRAERSIADLSASNAVADPEVIQQAMADGPGGIRFLAAPASPELADYVTTQHLTALVEELRRSFDCIVIDTASHLGEIVLGAVEMADRVLLVTDLSVTSVKNANMFRAVLDVLKVDASRYVLVINHREGAGEMETAHAEGFLSMTAAVEIPYAPAVIPTSVSRGVPFVVSHPQSQAAIKMEELARTLTNVPAGAAPAPAVRESGEGGRKRSRRLLGLGR
ncbi:MAG TPA: response regulator [Candidatus Binatia bacterium]|nr:response regulator [Candidatus Binatia bacterium]